MKEMGGGLFLIFFKKSYEKKLKPHSCGYQNHPQTSMSNSPICKALALQEAHLQIWMPRVVSYHSYWTRAEKMRVLTAIQERDSAFLSHYMARSAAANTMLERVYYAIIIHNYLVNAQFLFRYAKFRDTVWRKMCELEKITNIELERINSIANRKEYEAEGTLRNYLYEFLHVIWKLREVLRGSNDQTFQQDY